MLIRLLMLCLMPLLSKAAEQFAETIMLEGKALPLLETPLEEYWSLDHPRPRSLYGLSSACHRGYYGTWEIREDFLLLLDIERRHYVQTADGNFVEQRIPLSKSTVMGRNSEAPLIASWFSGVIPVARGFDKCRIGCDNQSPDVEYLYVYKGKVVRRIAVHNFDGPPHTNLADRIPEWDGTTSGEAAALQPDSKWVTIEYVCSHLDQIADHATTLPLRGVYFPGKIWFPPPEGPRVSFRLVIDDVRQLPAAGANVEITAEVRTRDLKPYFVVSKIKILPASEAVRRLSDRRN